MFGSWLQERDWPSLVRHWAVINFMTSLYNLSFVLKMLLSNLLDATSSGQRTARNETKRNEMVQ